MSDNTRVQMQARELAEWLAYQRTQYPDMTDADILARIVYVPEWRDYRR